MVLHYFNHCWNCFVGDYRFYNNEGCLCAVTSFCILKRVIFKPEPPQSELTGCGSSFSISPFHLYRNTNVEINLTYFLCRNKKRKEVGWCRITPWCFGKTISKAIEIGRLFAERSGFRKAQSKLSWDVMFVSQNQTTPMQGSTNPNRFLLRVLQINGRGWRHEYSRYC